jgi:hypothetical protein
MKETMAFEMQTVEARPDGFEITFTRPVDAEEGARAANYRVFRWPNGAVQRRRGRDGIEALQVKAVELAENGKSVRLLIDSMTPGYVVYINLDPTLPGDAGELLWSNEAWYSLNKAPVTESDPETSKADR